LGSGSLQFYVEHQPSYHYFNFNASDKTRLRPTALFDLLINNADRKGGHILLAPDGHIWLIDHGVCFHMEDKLRTVVWDFAGEQIPDALLADVERLLPGLDKEGELSVQLKPFLRPIEISALRRRAVNILKYPVYPFPSPDRRPFPWPPV
jgi:uncharacterized repeat protein (TIGR03843 family)